MHTEIDHLKAIALEIAAKPSTEDSTPDKYLAEQAKRVHKIITNHLMTIDNYVQRETFYYNTLTRLIEICDILYEHENKINPDVMTLINLLSDIRKAIPEEVNPKIRLPKAFIALNSETIISKCKAYVEIFKSNEVDPRLIKIAIIPFKEFSNLTKKLYWRNYKWLTGYQEKLDTIDWENADCNSTTEALTSLLLNYGFNDERFFIYCKKYIKARTNQYGTKKRRLSEFVECEKLILQDAIDEFPLYNHRWPNTSKKLIEWIAIEINTLKANDSFNEEEYKIAFNLDGDSLSLFWKLMMEHGITKKVPLDLYAKQIVNTCSSKDTVQLKSTTVKSNFHIKTIKHIRRIYDPLVAIIEDIKRFLRG